MAIHESRVLLSTITVWAFTTYVANMPAADFCCEIKAPCDTFSHESATRSRSPEVSSTAFPAQPPNLQPASLMDMGFAVIGQLARRRMPLIRVFYISWQLCSTLLSDPASRQRPCASLSLHFHQVVKRTSTFELSNMLGTPTTSPRPAPGALLIRQDPAYRLTWTLVPPAPGPLMRAPSPLETTFTQSASLSL